MIKNFVIVIIIGFSGNIRFFGKQLVYDYIERKIDG